MRTVMNNDPKITYYLLSIEELKELVEAYDDDDNIYTFVECYVDYLIKNRKIPE